MRTTPLAIGMLLTLTASVPALACPTKSSGTLQQAVDAWLASKNVPVGAMCVAAVRDGSSRANCKGKQLGSLDADPDTLFQIGSVTKTFTGTLLAKRVAQGTVDMTDVVPTLLPVFPPAPVTLKQLATHTSGLPRDEPWLTGNETANPADGSLADFSLCVSMGGLCPFWPWGNYSYSNFGFSVLGFSLAYADGHDGDWPEDIDESVLDQLEMFDTQVYERWLANKPVQFLNDAAHGYELEEGWGWDSVGSEPASTCPAHNPSGCLYASTNDMRRWLKYNMGLTTPGTTLGDARDLIRGRAHNVGSVGFGWHFDDNEECQGSGNWTVVYKDGSVGTQHAFIAYLQDPSAKYAVSPRGVVLLINREPADEDFSLRDLGYELLQKLRP